MTDGTENPKFAKHAARYNEFGCKSMEYNTAVSGVSLFDDRRTNSLLLMDHVSILSAETIALVSYSILGACKYKRIFEIWVYDLHVFSLFFLIWYLQGVKAKRVAQKKKSIVNKNRVIHFLTFSNNGGNC